MQKLIHRAIAVAIVLSPGLAFAASNDVQLGATDTVLSVNSVTVTIAGSASTTVEQISVDSTTFDLTFAAGSTITITAPDLAVTASSQAQSVATACASGVTTLTITATIAGTATIRPSATACSTTSASSGGGGGGGAIVQKAVSIPAPAPTVTTPVATTPMGTFSADLEVGAENDDVAALQAFLVGKGFLTMPAGIAMGYFGSLTKVALAKFQAANNISPAAGYFGPKTRAIVNAGGVVAPAVVKMDTPAPTVSGSFTRDLEVGVEGDDVKQLQVFLNTHGFMLAESGLGSSGNETSRFGGLTRTALGKFQAENGITPSVGYFGPKTRALVNTMMGM